MFFIDIYIFFCIFQLFSNQATFAKIDFFVHKQVVLFKLKGVLFVAKTGTLSTKSSHKAFLKGLALKLPVRFSFFLFTFVDTNLNDSYHD